jgi:hypothetical protein
MPAGGMGMAGFGAQSMPAGGMGMMGSSPSIGMGSATMTGKIGPPKIGPRPGAPVFEEKKADDAGLGELVGGMLKTAKKS